ncbi:ketopantoate hydroxymethyltransferase [Burkholderia sp. YR290]|nr:ketopantoate hydroxymethyltransferase [Burkholderia sp. YR290]
MSSYLQQSTNGDSRKPVTVSTLYEMRAQGEKIAALTCYDASFSSLMNDCGIDLLLVGDSLGNVVQGQRTTLPVTIDEIAYHTRCVARGNRTALLAADMPFGTYGNVDIAYANAVKLLQAGAQMVKLEGGASLAPIIAHLTERGIPVFGHVGLMPQFIHSLGGFKVQGKTLDSVERMKSDARAVEDAGASLLLIEAIPASVGADLTGTLDMPTIGIGAGPSCSGQILVMHDMLGVFPGKKARFVRNFMNGEASIGGAIQAYIKAVKDVSFPAQDHCF